MMKGGHIQHPAPHSTGQRRLWKDPELDPDSDLSSPTASTPSDRNSNDELETYESIAAKFAVRPTDTRAAAHRSFFRLCSNAVVIVQEFAMTSLLLAQQRVLKSHLQSQPSYHPQPLHYPNGTNQQQFYRYQIASSVALCTSLVLTFLYSAAADTTTYTSTSLPVLTRPPSNDTKARQKRLRRRRTWDTAFLAIVVRGSAALLQRLTTLCTADTVDCLVWLALLLHLVLCDYAYANGRQQPTHTNHQEVESIVADHSTNNTTATATATAPTGATGTSTRPPFPGGADSLTAVMVATTLLIAQLPAPTTSTSYPSTAVDLVGCLAIALFWFYPATRHTIAAHFPSYSSAANWMITGAICMATLFLLLSLGDMRPVYAFAAVVLGLGVGLPAWKCFVLQPCKVQIRGPWDIPTAASMQLDYRYK